MTDQPTPTPAKLGKIDPAKILLAELVEAERMVGRKLGREMMSGDLGLDTMQALVWVMMCRSDPAATFEQAGQLDLVTLVGLFEDEEVAAEPDPPSGSGSPNGSPPTAPPTSGSLPASATSGA